MPCLVDDCDATHCPICGGHMLGWYMTPGTICSSCQVLSPEEQAATKKETVAAYAAIAIPDDPPPVYPDRVA